jgi:quinol monooxygenase YgiN
MYAVVGIWTMDEARREEQSRALHEEIVPQTQSQPGFVTGYWMHDPETGKAHTTVIFDSVESAGAFKAFVESRAQGAAQAGVTGDILAMVEVLANAQSGHR